MPADRRSAALAATRSASPFAALAATTRPTTQAAAADVANSNQPPPPSASSASRPIRTTCPSPTTRAKASRTRSPSWSRATWARRSNTPGGPSGAGSSASRSRPTRPTSPPACRPDFEKALPTGPVLPLHVRLRLAQGPRPERPLARRPGPEGRSRSASSSPATTATRRRRTRWPGAGIMQNVVGFTVYGDYASPTRRPGSSTRWRRGTWTSRSSGARWPATSPGGSRCHCRSSR